MFIMSNKENKLRHEGIIEADKHIKVSRIFHDGFKFFFLGGHTFY